ncbi:uncharacterized protein tespa1 [Centroberyx gerrardi]|uniref:uncharacterized protein tespa1 n=1 Tax=Centroberyx gerrardi TaxID=166262 RepID=UPI003AAA98E6
MESPSSTVRRRAWIHSSRQWLTLEESDPQDPPGDLPFASQASIADDDVFSDGCSTGKIESWLLGCGLEACSENSSHLSVESMLKASNSFEDDLSLGADASALNVGGIKSKVGLPLPPPAKPRNSRLTSTPRQELSLPSLSLGHSMTSSCLSSSTSKTTSSVSEVLQLCSEDAEDTLYQLGFGCDEPQVTARIPTRFFTFPSQVEGINFRLFLESQLRRIREEDPCLSLASRFRQVEVLTAMANALYSLYSHVSRTPLQKLAPPEFTFSSPVERMGRFRSSVRSEPRSPVERLKDTVSKMCLYTGSPRGSDSTSPQPSPRKRSSLPDFVGIVLDKAKTGTSKKLDLGEYNGTSSTVDISPIRDGDKCCDNGPVEQTQQTAVDIGTLQHGNKVCDKDMQGSKQTDMAEVDGNKPTDLDSRTHSLRTSLASSLSGQTVIETDHHFFPCQPELDCGLTQSLACDAAQNENTRPADLIPVAKVTYDVICPQIVESIHQVPFCCQQTHGVEPNSLPHISSERDSSPDRSCSVSQKPHTASGQLANKGAGNPTAISKAEESYSGSGDDACSGEVGQAGASRLLPSLAPNGRYTPYRITVTGWEGDDVSPCSSNAPDSIRSPPVQTCQQSFSQGSSRYLNPLKHQAVGHISNSLQPVNSFELEEVHSAGEEDFGQSETTRTATSPLSAKHQYKGLVVRGDSMQSDSSGYAEEEVSPSSDRHGR